MLEKYELSCSMFMRPDRSRWLQGSATERVSLRPLAQDHILGLEDGKARLSET